MRFLYAMNTPLLTSKNLAEEKVKEEKEREKTLRL